MCETGWRNRKFADSPLEGMDSNFGSARERSRRALSKTLGGVRQPSKKLPVLAAHPHAEGHPRQAHAGAGARAVAAEALRTAAVNDG